MWQKHSVGDVGPLITYRAQSFDFAPDSGDLIFRIDRPGQGINSTFRIALTGVTWIPRHFIEIYNANKTW